MDKRKRLRLPDFDYSSNGAYFVTVCVKDMKCVLSSVTVGVGSRKVCEYIEALCK
ncbi:MAG: hypothetical protein IJ077_07585 [Eubacterium sp.]|nr:hypothetical protein [Eubacterium sp.]